jgi:ketosteroid isomerase-like protein
LSLTHIHREDAGMAHDPVHDEEVAEVTHLTAEAASALIRGDIRRYLTFIGHADDYTLLPPFGGEPRRGFDSSDEALEATARFFHGGDADVEVVEAYASGDLVVLVVIERQHGEVGDLPDQDWSLRVTLVFRREGGGWRLAHRHATPLVHPISLEQAAALARGS